MTDIENITLSELMKLMEQENNETIKEILIKYKEKWNLLIEENRKLNNELHLKNISMTGEKLSGIDLSGIVIEDSDFSDADLTGSKLDNSLITGTNFSGANLYGASIKGARLSQSNLSNARIYGMIGNAYMTGSVNLFDAYWKQEEDNKLEDLYPTNPDILKRDARLREYYEHHDENEDEDKGYY